MFVKLGGLNGPPREFHGKNVFNFLMIVTAMIITIIMM